MVPSLQTVCVVGPTVELRTAVGTRPVGEVSTPSLHAANATSAPAAQQTFTRFCMATQSPHCGCGTSLGIRERPPNSHNCATSGGSEPIRSLSNPLHWAALMPFWIMDLAI